MYSDELYHHGILGQRWGIRRYQKKDGSLTPAGLKRYGSEANFKKIQRAEAKAQKESEKAKYRAKTEAEIAKINKKYKINKPDEKKEETKAKEKEKSSKPKAKSINEMTDDEIRARINRIQLENQLKSLTPVQQTKGQKFVKMVSDTAVPAIKNAAKDALEKYLKKKLNEALGVDGKTADDVSKELERQAKDLGNKVKIMNSQKILNANNASNNTSGSNNSNQSSTSNNTSGNSNSNQNSTSNNSSRSNNSNQSSTSNNVSGSNNSNRSSTSNNTSGSSNSDQSSTARSSTRMNWGVRTPGSNNSNQSSTSSNSSNGTEYYDSSHVRVTGTGRNPRRNRPSNVVDATWTEVESSSTTSNGRDYVENALGLSSNRNSLGLPDNRRNH